MDKTVADVMTRTVAVIAPDASTREAARRMDELNVGALPVCDGGRLVGILTDRDIAVRSTAAGHPPDATRVDAVMTEHVRFCHPEDSAGDALALMSRHQIRRVPVVDQDEHVVGIVSLGDFSADRIPGAGEALERISTPSEPDLTGTLSQRRAEPAGVLAEHEPREPSRPNDEIQEEVTRVLADAAVDDSEIDVSATDGALTLDGTVQSFEEKTEVERLGSHVRGVVTVVNNLRIRKHPRG